MYFSLFVKSFYFNRIHQSNPMNCANEIYRKLNIFRWNGVQYLVLVLHVIFINQWQWQCQGFSLHCIHFNGYKWNGYRIAELCTSLSGIDFLPSSALIPFICVGIRIIHIIWSFMCFFMDFYSVCRLLRSWLSLFALSPFYP